MLAFFLSLAATQDAIPDEVQRMLLAVSQFHNRVMPKTPDATFQIGSRPGMRLVIKENVTVGGQQGAVPPGTKPSPPPPQVFCHSQLIVIAGDKPLAATEVERLEWLELKQDEKSKTSFLGTAHGRSFYGKMPPHEMIWYIQLGGLGGGADPIELAFESLEIASTESNAFHAQKYLSAYGRKTMRRLSEWTESGREHWRRALGAIALMEGDGSTEFLVKFYSGGDEEKRRSVLFSLEGSPLRKEAKALYQDMITVRGSTYIPAKAAIAFEWTDFAPILEGSLKYDHGGSLHSYTTAFLVARRLRGLPVPERVVKAIGVMRSPTGATEYQLKEAKTLLVNYADPDPIAVAAFASLHLFGKGTDADNPFAREVLLALPKFAVKAFLERVVSECPDKREVERARKLLELFK